MSSQTKTHEYATSCDIEYFLTTPDGLITALVEWRSDDDGQVYVCGYSLSDEAIADVPTGANCGREVSQLIRKERLIDNEELLLGKGRFLRIDDNRPGHNWAYCVWTGSKRLRKVSFVPNAVYHWFDNKQEVHDFPRLDSFDEVMALVHDPDTKIITMLDDETTGVNIYAPEVVSKLGELDGRLIVWDRTSIARAEAADDN